MEQQHPEKYHLEDEFPKFFSFLREGRVKVSYSPIFREFSIPLEDSIASQQMLYCPWSGKKFPESLRDAYFDILEEEYKFTEPTMDHIWDKRVPVDMLSETWWVKRGL